MHSFDAPEVTYLISLFDDRDGFSKLMQLQSAIADRLKLFTNEKTSINHQIFFWTKNSDSKLS